MRIHSATMPLRTFDLREVCYEGALERCCLVVGRLRPDIVKVAEQPPSVTYIDDDGRRRRHIFDFRFIEVVRRSPATCSTPVAGAVDKTTSIP
jgi:hypothetical protein